jgi:L-asparagine transporter-like permease
VRSSTPSLAKMWSRWVLTVASWQPAVILLAFAGALVTVSVKHFTKTVE